MKTLLALVWIFSTASLQAQTFSCSNHVTVSTCNSYSHRADSLVRTLEHTKERLAHAQSVYQEALQNASSHYSEIVQKADERAAYTRDRCGQSYDRSLYNLRCYDGLFYSDCEYKEDNLKDKYSYCLSNADERQQSTKQRTLESYNLRITRAKARYDRLNLSYQTKLNRDQTRLDDGKNQLNQCTSCLASQQSNPSPIK